MDSGVGSSRTPPSKRVQKTSDESSQEPPRKRSKTVISGPSRGKDDDYGFRAYLKRFDAKKPHHEPPPESGKPLESKASRALKFEIFARWNGARASRLTLPHGPVETPVFMPVGTQGTIKGLTSHQIEQCGCRLILSNTYHLGNRPGGDIVEGMGRLHSFMNWKHNLLTDSGGFQMVSLLDLAEITEEGVTFQSPNNGTRMLLTPERSMEIQNQIGADIMMALDDVCPSTTPDRKRVDEAMHRTLRWLDRCVRAHARPDHQNLYGIVQGGLDPALRAECLKEMVARNLPGYAIGGLAGGEDKALFWRVVKQCCDELPADKPRYLMGVGYTLDLVVCSALGVDQFDCVYPCRTARFGTAITRKGLLKLRSKTFRGDATPLDPSTRIGRTYTRGYLHDVAAKGGIGSQLLTLHNIEFLQNFMGEMRAAIRSGTFPDFVRSFIQDNFPKGNCPLWAREALAAAGIQV